jgi:hypothetical protein
MRLGDSATTAGRLVWSVLVVGWPLLLATGMIVWQLRRRARQLQPVDEAPSGHRDPERQRWVLLGLTATAAGLLALAAVLVVLPVLLVPAGAITDAKELYKARNDVRGTLVQVLAGGLVATGLVFTARTLDLNRSGQVTERFTRAVDQLGQREPGKLDVRLGGIYALERIARDSATDLPTVVRCCVPTCASTAPGRRVCPARATPISLPTNCASCRPCRYARLTCRPCSRCSAVSRTPTPAGLAAPAPPPTRFAES